MAGTVAVQVTWVAQVLKMMKFGVVDNGILIMLMMAGVNCEPSQPSRRRHLLPAMQSASGHSQSHP